jgi:hypothetical protein
MLKTDPKELVDIRGVPEGFVEADTMAGRCEIRVYSVDVGPIPKICELVLVPFLPEFCGDDHHLY